MRASVVVPCTRLPPQYVAIGGFATAVARIASSERTSPAPQTGETASPMRSSVRRALHAAAAAVRRDQLVAPVGGRADRPSSEAYFAGE